MRAETYYADYSKSKRERDMKLPFDLYKSVPNRNESMVDGAIVVAVGLTIGSVALVLL